MKLDPVVENRIINIPVAEETEGVTPILSKTGLKMTPPPRPNAPETQPPRKAKMQSFEIANGVNLMSL